MTKAEIIAAIAHRTEQDKTAVSETVEAFFKVVRNAMIEGDNVYVRGFGSFVIKKELKKLHVIYLKIQLSLYQNTSSQVSNQLKVL